MITSYSLDTSTCIDLIRNKKPQVRLNFKMAAASGDEIHISSIVLHELSYGADKSDQPQRSHALLQNFLCGVRVLDFNADDATKAGAIRAALAKIGNTIGPFDTLIAGQAVNRKSTVITGNIKEFSRVPHLIAMDWSS